ncbi:conserved hypothetical protein [Pediculus humanus corporis]|uniref:Autophagy-related protein 13 n=1 Tax=Pediculus humanus subsp. corporis TaxID=121224 RepID=E0W0V2_PEDHC|nr:uncharacterized protein Phum_PHUM564240 [Pediculus humanus corporis]EEB19258.1 conserved hypothetical protein [Pediculus humanus corporis]
MASVKLNALEKKDLDKFIKFLALKAAQIIVQSRLGEKIQTQCKSHLSGTDWVIYDVIELVSIIYKFFNGDIHSLQTVDFNDVNLREREREKKKNQFRNCVLPEQCDPRMTYAVYNRMGILLKSLVSVTRVTPAYKLSRRQSPDSYVICYRIYRGEPQLHSLGEGYKQVRVGQLCTPIGTIHISVSYRTKMTISPQATGRDNSIILKSDHFRPDFSPKHCDTQTNDELNASSVSETMKVGAFANRQEVLDDLIMPDAPFSSLLATRQHHQPPSPQNCNFQQSNNLTRGNSLSDLDSDADGNGNLTPRIRSRADSRSSCSIASNADDFIMVDLKTPFANTNANTDLGTFYRECQTAPPLQTFNDQPTLGETVDDLTKQLQAFELSVPKYEQLLLSLCNADNNN